MAKISTDSAKQLRMIEVSAMRDIAVAALSNPIVTLVGGVIVVSAAEKAKIVSDDWASTLKGGVIAVATIQALSPIIKEHGMTDGLLALGAGVVTGGLADTGVIGGSISALQAANPRGSGSFLTKLKNLLLGTP